MFNFKDRILFKGDKILWYVIIGLLIASIMVVYSATGRLAYVDKGGNTSFYLIKQVVFSVGCLLIMFGLQSVHYKYFLAFSKLLLILSFVLLLWAKFWGTTLNDANRWLTIPVVNYTFQPSELAKIAIIMYTARIIAFYQNEEHCDDEVLKSLLIFVGPLIFFIFLENVSTSLLLTVICFTMLFVGRLRMKMVFISVGALVGLLALILLLAFTVPQLEKVGRIATLKNRVSEFFGDKTEKEGYSYQSQQAKIAIAKGGFFGVGPGNSEQRNFLPHPYSDFIFAIIIEEYGLLGGGIILLLYLAILFRIGVIVKHCTRTFPALLVTGLGLCIVFQAFINMGVCVGILPVTGQPLPLVSMGGTSMLITSAAFGMILSVSNTFPGEEKAQVQHNEAEEDEEE